MEATPLSGGGGGSGAGTHSAQEVRASFGLIPPEELVTQFEQEFTEHLRKSDKAKRLRFGALGAGVGGALGVAASPVFLPGLAAAALVGSAGSYYWAKRKGEHSLQKHSAGGQSAPPLMAPGAEASFRPTLRRLKYLVKWGHWQLLTYEDAPAEWRAAVVDEVVRAFSPWVQQMYVLRALGPNGSAESSSRAQEVFQHLAPLYQLLQRTATFEAVQQMVSLVRGAHEVPGEVDERIVIRCHIVFPTIMEAISIMDRLTPATQAKLVQGKAPLRRGGRQHRRLGQIVSAIRGVLEAQGAPEALAECNQQDGHEFGTPETMVRPVSSEDRPHPSSPRTPEPLVVPPEGVENEAGGGFHELEYFSCSGESETEQLSPKSKGQRSPLRRGAAAPSPNTSASAGNFARRAARFPRGVGKHEWTVFDESTFDVRSASYLKDRKKVPAGPAMLDLVGVDFMMIGPGGPIWNPAIHPDFGPAAMRRQGDDRFLFVQNWIFPPYQCVILGALDPNAPWLGEGTAQGRTWSRFLNMSPEERRQAFKVIISVEEGPWLVKRAAPKKPVLIGKQVQMQSHHEPGKYLEIVIDLSTGRAEQMATGIVMKALKGLKLALGTLVEGKLEDELPEALLLCPSMLGMDTSKLLCPAALGL